MPESHIVVRPVDFADSADVENYLNLLDAYSRDPMGADRPLPAEVRARLPGDLAHRPGVYCLLAEHSGRVVGFASCFLGYSTFQARPLLNVHDIAVLPEWRGQSIARQLLQTIGELARQLGCCRITLEVRADNPRARRLYERAGFGPGQCSLFMEKPV